MSNHTKDPDDLWGDEPVFVLEIKVRRNGSMSTAGNINQVEYACAVLDRAKDAVREHARRFAPRGDGLIVPPSDTPWESLFR